MVSTVKNVEDAIGDVNYSLSKKNKISRTFARSPFVVDDIKIGEPFTQSNIRSIWPIHGLVQKFLPEILVKSRTEI